MNKTIKTDVKDIKKVVEEYNNDLDKIKKELRNIQSKKSRLLKQKFKSTYEQELETLLKNEQILKEARGYLEPKDKFVTEYTEEDIKSLNYIETLNALNTIRSKKSLSKYAVTEDKINEEYKNACKIEQLLLEHKNNIKPLDDNVLSKNSLKVVIEELEKLDKLNKKDVIKMLRELL